ncbi:MAG: response regulator, partial [Candidatus Omnitrophica bacterium]|nr:response regulator [Candidatus Omnitrophota bacterium]
MKNKPKILIVDDEPINVKLLTANLISYGYELLTASNGEDTLRIASDNDIDLILLDVMMPGIDGFEVTKRLKAGENTRFIPIVLITSLKETRDKIKGIESGCDDFLSKPVDRLELKARVQSLIKIKSYYDYMRGYEKELEVKVTKRTGELQQALKKIEDASLETIYRLSRAAEYRDEETGAHIQRMSHYAAAVARRMGLDESTVKSILYAAPMHDAGKIAIPDSILLKPGKLDPDEWEIMKQHTVIGAEILKGSETEFIKLAEIIALTHHEKWDG